VKYIRYEDIDKTEKYGVLEGELIREIEWDLFGDYMPTDTTHNINDVKILPPCTPTKIVCVGLNYKDHAEEMNSNPPEDPRIFIKPGYCCISRSYVLQG